METLTLITILFGVFNDNEYFAIFSSVQFILFALINYDYNNYNNNYAFGRQSRKIFYLFKRLP